MIGFTDQQAAAIKNSIDIAIAQHKKHSIAVIGDSGSCEEPIDGPAWPARLNQLFCSYGMGNYEVQSFALGGCSFGSIQSQKDYSNFTKTQIDRVVEINPLFVIVMLGANDFFSGQYTQSQVFNSVASVFQEIKTRLPNTKILYLHQHFYDSSNFYPGNLKNKGVIPFLFKLRTTGFLANTYNADCLDDAVSPATKVFCENMNGLKSYIKTLTTVDYVDTIDLYKIGRLAGVISDGLHPNYFGRGLLCMMIAFVLKDYFPEMMYRGVYSQRQDIEHLFNALLMSQGDGYIKNENDSERYDLESASNYTVDLTQWYLPRKIKLTFTERLSVASGILLVHFMNADQNATVEHSINESEFAAFAKTNDTGNAFIELPLAALDPAPAKGIYRLRWKIGQCVLGPYSIELY